MAVSKNVIIEVLKQKETETVSMVVFVLIFLVKLNISPPTSLLIVSPPFLLQIALVRLLTKVFLLSFLIQSCSIRTSSPLLLFLIQRCSS